MSSKRICGPGRGWVGSVLLMVLYIVPLVHTLPASCQIHSDTLAEAKVRARKKALVGDIRLNGFAEGQKITVIDSAVMAQYQLQSVAALLAQQVPVFVKSYGLNGLATLSFRGASAAQSQVLWNGVPIQNAALGVADVSTLPVLLMSKVSVLYGGSAALMGSGNVGGALLLDNEDPVFDTGQHSGALMAGVGSYGQYMAGGKGSVAGRRWYLSAKGFAQVAKNDFEYDKDGSRQRMANSQLQSAAAIVHGAYKIGEGQVAQLTAWYQRYDREIPPALFEAASYKQQNDAALRLLASWSKISGSNTWYARSSLIRDEVRYNDAAVQLHTHNTVYQYYQEVGWKKDMAAYGQLLLMAPVQLAWLPPQLGSDAHRQGRAALAAAYNIKLLHSRLGISLNARAEAVNSQRVLLPGSGLSFRAARWLVLRANAQRTYRVPTLNELYYNPGGNASLKPEQGWTQDAGYAANATAGRLSLHHDLSVYNRNIADWVLWLGGAVWTPHNIAKVHSHGIETENKMVYTMGKWQWRLGLNTAYSLSTTVASYIYNDGSIGRQIPYAPRYNGQVNGGCTYGQLSVTYLHTYTGYRFTTTDESDYIVPYHTGNVQLGWGLPVGRWRWQLTAQCNNIWNRKYMVVKDRPMPGTNWQVGLRLER